MGTFWRNLLSEHVFVYNNIRKRLHTVVNGGNLLNITFQPLFKSAPKWCVVCPGMPTVNNNNNESSAQHAHCQCVTTMSHQHSMPTVNVEEPIVLWEPLGTFWRSLLFFGNLWEPLGTFWRNLLFFGNVLEESIVLWEYLLFGLGGPLEHYYCQRLYFLK